MLRFAVFFAADAAFNSSSSAAVSTMDQYQIVANLTVELCTQFRCFMIELGEYGFLEYSND